MIINKELCMHYASIHCIAYSYIPHPQTKLFITCITTSTPTELDKHCTLYNTSVITQCSGSSMCLRHRLNMELDLSSLFGLYSSCTAEAPSAPPPHPPHLGSYTRTLLVSQDRRHLFVTPWSQEYVLTIII